MAFMDKVGGCLTMTVWGAEVKEPQSFVVVSVIWYVPELLNWKTGFAEVLVVLFMYEKDD